LAVSSAASHTSLSQIAAVIGQAGVTAPDKILALVEVFNRLASASGIAAEDITTDMVRIENAFGVNLQESAVEATKLANVINMLDKSTAAASSEILAALADFAPFANMLNISQADAAAFAATLISVGLSADEAGTALRNMVVNLPRHAEELSGMMSGLTRGLGPPKRSSSAWAAMR